MPGGSHPYGGGGSLLRRAALWMRQWAAGGGGAAAAGGGLGLLGRGRGLSPVHEDEEDDEEDTGSIAGSDHCLLGECRSE